MSEIKTIHLTSVALAGLLALGIQQTAQAAPANDDMQPAQMRHSQRMDRRADADHRMKRQHTARYYRGDRERYATGPGEGSP